MTLKPIISIAAKAGISRKYLELYGDYKPKIALDILKSSTPALPAGRQRAARNASKYIAVTGITHTHLGAHLRIRSANAWISASTGE